MLGLIQAIKYDLYAYNSYFVICPSKYRIWLRRYQTSVSIILPDFQTGTQMAA